MGIMSDDGANADLSASFRAKAVFMKSWKPASTPSNRDRLELYGLHKQVVSGDAQQSLPSTATAAEKSKYQAWKSKKGLSQTEAMRLYIQECDRQLRVYGSTPQTPTTTPITDGTTPPGETSYAPRGLAAIPLLCAAASESQNAYLRRLAGTTVESSWWSRQEPLCATPGTLGALPEAILLGLAAKVERSSLTPVLSSVRITSWQSFLWPVHNCLLSLWMGLILVLTVLGACLNLIKTIVWGARRTGIRLEAIWKEEIHLSAESTLGISASHQPLSARLVALGILPLTTIVQFAEWIDTVLGSVISSLVFSAAMGVTWWYWCLVLPWLAFWFLAAALGTGVCFAIIDLAGV